MFDLLCDFISIWSIIEYVQNLFLYRILQPLNSTRLFVNASMRLPIKDKLKNLFISILKTEYCSIKYSLNISFIIS